MADDGNQIPNGAGTGNGLNAGAYSMGDSMGKEPTPVVPPIPAMPAMPSFAENADTEGTPLSFTPLSSSEQPKTESTDRFSVSDQQFPSASQSSNAETTAFAPLSASFTRETQPSIFPSTQSQPMATSTSVPSSAEATMAIPPIEPPANGNLFDGAFDDDGAGAHVANASAVKTRNPKLPMIITLSVIGILLVAAVAGFFGARAYFQGKAAPGVTFAGSSVAGQSADQLKTTVRNAVKNTTFTLTDDQGNSKQASLSDLGVEVNVDRTVSNLLNAKRESGVGAALNSVNPLSKSNVSLTAQVNDLSLNTYVTQTFVGEDDRAVASSFAYDANAQAFVTVQGKDGRAAQTDQVVAAVNKAIANPGANSKVSVTFKNVTMPVSVDSAQQATDQANARLINKIVLDNGNGKSFELPAETVASWIKPNADLNKGTLSLEYDDQAISTYLQQEVPNQLNQDKVDQEDAVDGNGTVLATVTKGVNGVKVKDVSSVVSQVEQALQNGQGGNLTVAADVENFQTVQKKAEYRIVVDRSSQTATVYHNEEQVKTFNVCTGTTNKHETDPGTSFIYLKYSVQDMTGNNDDGSRYLSKGVKWVSYFNGGEGFHTASWNNYGIAHGDPANHGSHGCVNMYEADAKWIYDNCPEGTIVQVTGTTPSSAVR